MCLCRKTNAFIFFCIIPLTINTVLYFGIPSLVTGAQVFFWEPSVAELFNCHLWAAYTLIIILSSLTIYVTKIDVKQYSGVELWLMSICTPGFVAGQNWKLCAASSSQFSSKLHVTWQIDWFALLLSFQ